MTTGMHHGYRLGIWNILDMQIGSTLQLAVVGVGLGAVPTVPTLAFNIVKWC